MPHLKTSKLTKRRGHLLEEIRYMDIWIIGKILMRQHYLKKKIFSFLDMENVTDADYKHAKRVFKDFQIKNLGAYDHLYV